MHCDFYAKTYEIGGDNNLKLFFVYLDFKINNNKLGFIIDNFINIFWTYSFTTIIKHIHSRHNAIYFNFGCETIKFKFSICNNKFSTFNFTLTPLTFKTIKPPDLILFIS